MQDGIADNPFEGIADMRNVDITSVPTQATVIFKETPVTAPPSITNMAYTASGSTNRLTVASIGALYEGCAISLNQADLAIFSYLLVGAGGGGGGGSNDSAVGGGGGAGGFRTATGFTIPFGTHAVTVGTGGAGGVGTASGSSGVASSIGALVSSAGGGGGGGNFLNGLNGGSGGGAGNGNPPAIGGTGTVGQGNNGGDANIGPGGGGGASAVGQTPPVNDGRGGNGGDGTASSISGASVTYGGGGGGGGDNSATAGTGGAGGGGNGSNSGNGAAGTANRGGGGGGAYASAAGTSTGGVGGTGIGIISYATGAASATGGTVTTSGGNTIHTFTTTADFILSSGLEDGVVYYVRNIVGNTFQLSASAGGDIIDLVGDSSGTFSTYTYGNMRGISALNGAPLSYWVDRVGQAAGLEATYLVDASNYAWVFFPAVSLNLPANSLIFLGNIGGIGASSTSQNGIGLFDGYIILFGLLTTDIADLAELIFGDGPLAEWDYAWEVVNTSASAGRVSTLLGQDAALYYTSSAGVGSLIENAGESFDPTDDTTYTLNNAALTIPSNDRSTCLAELGVNLLVGGALSFVYPWDRVSTSFTYPIIVPDFYIRNIIGTNQNAYVFAGNRGRIYITNGSACDLFKKVSDYVTGASTPYFRWWDASFARNQLLFSFTATLNAGTALTTVNGAWAIDVTSEALRMMNKITNSGYAGQSNMVAEGPTPSVSVQPLGTALIIGWTVSTTYGVDVGTGTPYDSFESFIDFDMIPVGTYLNPLSPTQLEWKTAYPIGANGTAESIRIYYRKNLFDSWTLVGTTTATGTTVVGSTTGTTTSAVGISDYYVANFEKAQWIQLRVEMSSNATTPTYNRLTELRLREWIN